jgi:hypothetical protein
MWIEGVRRDQDVGKIGNFTINVILLLTNLGSAVEKAWHELRLEAEG